jgi:hypothetical protein
MRALTEDWVMVEEDDISKLMDEFVPLEIEVHPSQCRSTYGVFFFSKIFSQRTLL